MSISCAWSRERARAGGTYSLITKPQWGVYCGVCMPRLAYESYSGSVWASGVNTEEGYQNSKTRPVLSGGYKHYRTVAHAFPQREDVARLFPKYPSSGSQTSSSCPWTSGDPSWLKRVNRYPVPMRRTRRARETLINISMALPTGSISWTVTCDLACDSAFFSSYWITRTCLGYLIQPLVVLGCRKTNILLLLLLLLLLLKSIPVTVNL